MQRLANCTLTDKNKSSKMKKLAIDIALRLTFSKWIRQAFSVSIAFIYCCVYVKMRWQKMSVLDTVAHAYGSKLEQWSYDFTKVRGTQLSKV